MSTQLSRKHRHLLGCCFCLGVAVWLLAGCSLLPSSGNEPASDEAYAHVLPSGWEAIRDWQTVNLDLDEDDENLLLFRFDNGQIGALIQEGDPQSSISPPAFIFPRYLDDYGSLGQGIIAAPGTDESAIGIVQVEGDEPQQELVILGGGRNLTFVWWRGAGLGYGVTQLYAPGGFAIDWDEWQKKPSPITSITGFYPLADYRARSDLCNRLRYTRRTDLPSSFGAIVFSGAELGLHFCSGMIPAYPFAPEGVVMAYLQLPRTEDSGVNNLLTPGTTLAQLDAESASERFATERIQDIAAYPSVPIPVEDMTETLTTAVCVEFAETANPTLRRWLVYTLRFQPADAAQALPDRWTVSGAVTEPPPAEAPQTGYCDEVLKRNAP